MAWLPSLLAVEGEGEEGGGAAQEEKVAGRLPMLLLLLLLLLLPRSGCFSPMVMFRLPSFLQLPPFIGCCPNLPDRRLQTLVSSSVSLVSP